MSTFLFATMPVPGHVAPIVPVARALAERGHEVVWYGSRFHAGGIEGSGARFRPIRSTLDYGDDRYDEHFPGRSSRKGLRKLVFDFEHIFIAPIEGYLTDLRAIVAEVRPDALLHDPAVVAGQIMGMQDGLPAATLNVTVLGIPGRTIPPFGLGLLPTDGPLGRLRNGVLYALVDQVIFGHVNRVYRRLARRHGWPILPFRPQVNRWLYLQPSVESFEFSRPDLPPQVHFIGPLLPETREGFVPPAWWEDVETARRDGRRVVLVTQGTVATDPVELIEPTLAALADEDVFVVVAGADRDRLAAPANARVERFVPFTEFMPRVHAYVTNGGYGGVTIALANGVPVVTAGTTEDKADVGQRVAYSGVGTNLKTSRPSPDQIRRAVFSVLDDPAYAERARAVAADCARHDAPTEAANLLERLAETQQPVLRG